MIAAPRRIFVRTALFLASLAPVAFGEVLEFRAAFASTSPAASGTATFVSVEALPVPDLLAPVQAVAAGRFTGEFRLGPDQVLPNPNGEDGVLAALVRDPAAQAWNVAWLLQALSDPGNARINDVALAPGGEIFVTGTFEGEVTFLLPPPLVPIVLTAAPGQAEGFVAWADPAGSWIDAFPAGGMQPNSIALDPAGEIYLSGPPVLARRYDRTGGEIWSRPAPPTTVSLRHVTVAPGGPTGDAIYVNGDALVIGGAGAPSQDAFVARLDLNTGAVSWTTFISSPGEEHAGGLGVGPLGRVRTSFSSDDSLNVTVDGAALQELPTLSGRHAHLLFLRPDGTLAGDNLLGASLAAGSVMETSDLALDRAGNTYVAIGFTGQFDFAGVPRNGREDAGVVAIDPTGAAIRFHSSSGAARAFGNAVAAPDRNLQIVVGGFDGTAPEQFDTIQLDANPEERGFFAALEPTPGQDAFILVSPLNEPLDQMVQRLRDVGGDVYRALDLRNEQVRFVSAFLTTEQLAELTPFFQFVLDQPLALDGTVSPSGYALEALNSAPATAPYSYDFPETCRPAVLYLIDSAIDNSSGYFDGNPNLTLGSSTLVRAIGDPLTSSAFDHGTAMLSMIAGPTYGVAQGTPLTVINYDIYPDGVSARLSALVEALALANANKALHHPYDPSVYCVASSATSPAVSSGTLKAVVDYTLSDAVYASVVFSAGNTSGLAEDYTPSDLGAKSGAICAGAIDHTNTQVPVTRGGGAVDLWAPGDTVAAADTAGAATAISGTSASTALTAGAALVYLSANPTATPAALETALVTTYGQASGVGQILHVPPQNIPGFTSFADWGSWYGLTDATASGNDDGDPWTNAEEYHWGLDPLVANFEGSLVTLSFLRSTSTLTYSFPLACSLYQTGTLTDPNPLRDGSTLCIERSSNLLNWTDITSSLTLVEEGHSDDQVILSFDYVVDSVRWFFRVHVQ